MAKNLVIVESPTKAKTIKQFLKKDYDVQSSFGHIRDLPKSKMGIDVDHKFEPSYVIPPKAKTVIKQLKARAKGAEVYLATDEDREGEAISWHLTQALGLDPKKTKRIVFHEITKPAILEAIANPRTIDQHLVDAQQARRILDRLVGYDLSPFLWSKIKRGLSAGRVQSVAVRLIVEREAEITAFKPEEFWNIAAQLTKDKQEFTARLHKRDGKLIGKMGVTDAAGAKEITDALKSAKYTVANVEKKERKKHPYPPFTTSTLQQAAANRLGFTAKKTMFVAQQLYEGVAIPEEGSVGLITYMRTDSLNLSKLAIEDFRKFIGESYSKKYVPSDANFFKNRSKGAQEAHEAIRPTSVWRTPEKIGASLTKDQLRLYTLIWQRAVACQMTDALMDATQVDITANDFSFRASGQTIRFDGFLKVYAVATEKADDNNAILPPLAKNDVVDLKELKSEQKFTQPPARYNEASLVKKLEELGIGRPSTYAPTISTVQDRGYVEKVEGKLQPTEIGTLVNDVLVKHFDKIVDYSFTAKMEESLDAIARGESEWVPVIAEFYKPFKENLDAKSKELDKKELTEKTTDEKCEKCGRPMVNKMGRFGRFLACSGYPECKNTKPLEEDAAQQKEQLADKKCPECGKPLVIKYGRFGQFLGCSGYPDCKHIEKIEKKTGVQCPKCGEGEIIEKRSKRGRTFYACNRYPKCDFALWNKPTGKTCPECKSLLVFAGKSKISCSNKECKNSKEDLTE